MNKKSIRKLVKKQTYQQSSENFKNDINSKFSELNDYCNYLEVKYETVDSPCWFQDVSMIFYLSVLCN